MSNRNILQAQCHVHVSCAHVDTQSSHERLGRSISCTNWSISNINFRKSTRIDKDTISVSKRRLPLPPEPLKLSRQWPVTNRWKQHLRRFAEQGRAVEVSARFWSWRICSQGSLDIHQASFARVIIQKNVENHGFLWKWSTFMVDFLHICWYLYRPATSCSRKKNMHHLMYT